MAGRLSEEHAKAAFSAALKAVAARGAPACVAALAASLHHVRDFLRDHVRALWRAAAAPAAAVDGEEEEQEEGEVAPAGAISCDHVEAAAAAAAHLVAVDGRALLRSYWPARRGDAATSGPAAVPALPLFLLCLKALQRVARDTVNAHAAAAQAGGAPSSRSPGVATYSTPSKSPLTRYM